MPTREADPGLAAVMEPLVPSPSVSGARIPASTHVALPSRHSPRILVPKSPARAAAAALQNYTRPSSLAGRAKLGLITSVARVGLMRLAWGGPAIGGPGTFIGHLASVLNSGTLTASVHIGPARINRKPVVRMMDRSGAAVAFAKLGVNELTCARVRAETTALRSLNNVQIPGLVVPELMAAGTWHGMNYLVLSPLKTSGVLAASEIRIRASEALVAAFPTETVALAEAPWWHRTWRALQASDPDNPEVRRLLTIGRALLERYGDTKVTVGAAHGDWSPWNTSAANGAVVAWDWERFATDVPVGWDAIHFDISAEPDPLRGLRRLHGRIVGDHGPGSYHEVLLATYLLQRGTNYVSERHQDAGSPNGPLSRWLLPVLECAVPTEAST